MNAIITLEDKLNEAKRELQARIDLYPQHVERGMISAGAARLRIEIQKHIVADYETLAAQMKLPL